MNKQLEIIDQRQLLGQDFKVYGDFENPLFLAKDVAIWIGYDNSSVNKMINKVDEDEKLNGLIFRAGQNREVTMLTEDGLYEVLMQSRKPIAKSFKKEVKKILKEIRTMGMYITDQVLQSDKFEQLLANYAQDKIQSNLALERCTNALNSLDNKCTELESKLETFVKSVDVMIDLLDTSNPSICYDNLMGLYISNGKRTGDQFRSFLFKFFNLSEYSARASKNMKRYIIDNVLIMHIRQAVKMAIKEELSISAEGYYYNNKGFNADTYEFDVANLKAHWTSSNGKLICGICGEPIETDSDIDLDHVNPKSKCGDRGNIIYNIIPVHKSCNLEKYDRAIGLIWEEKKVSAYIVNRYFSWHNKYRPVGVAPKELIEIVEFN